MNLAWILQAAGVVVLVGGALAILVKAGAWVLRTIRRINEFLEDWNGEAARPGYPYRPGVMERLVDLEMHVKTVVHEVQPNSGSSLKDQVTRLEEHVIHPKEGK